MKKRHYGTPTVILCIVGLVMAFTAAATAGELEYPKSCFGGDELAQLRAWEKQWVGKKIDASNIDGIKEYVVPSFYDLIKDTEHWGDTWFTVVPYRQVPATAGNIAFTKKNYGKTKIGSESELLGFEAGVPFPDTTDGLEMAYNFRTRSFADAYESTDEGYIVDGKLKYDMSLKLNNKLCFFAGRTDTPPVPEFPKNPKNIWRAFSMESFEPPEVRNQRIMEIQYKDFMKPYDMWMWLPAIRRIKRRSTTERQDSSSGGDNCGFDNLGWDGPIRINTYKYLGSKDLLMSRHTDPTKLQHTPGHCVWNNTQRERVKVHALEVKNKDPNFMYSKIVWYLDPESWQILWADRYDRRGRLWKIAGQCGWIGKGYKGIDVAHFIGNLNIDVQRIHGTLGVSRAEYGKDFDQNIFTLYYLQKHGY